MLGRRPHRSPVHQGPEPPQHGHDDVAPQPGEDVHQHPASKISIIFVFLTLGGGEKGEKLIKVSNHNHRSVNLHRLQGGEETDLSTGNTMLELGSTPCLAR